MKGQQADVHLNGERVLHYLLQRDFGDVLDSSYDEHENESDATNGMTTKSHTGEASVCTSDHTSPLDTQCNKKYARTCNCCISLHAKAVETDGCLCFITFEHCL
jgi:hypothetical protein